MSDYFEGLGAGEQARDVAKLEVVGLSLQDDLHTSASDVRFVCVCVCVYAATLLSYRFVPKWCQAQATKTSSMLATGVGRILLLVCCFESCMLILGSHFYHILSNDTF